MSSRRSPRCTRPAIDDIAFYNYGHLRPTEPRLDRRGACGARRVDMDFKGKVVAITGAAGGIGQALCRHFAARGRRSRAIDRSPAVTGFAAELRKEGIDGRSRRRRHRRRGRGRRRFRRGSAPLSARSTSSSTTPASRTSEPRRNHAGGIWRDDVNGNLNGAYYCCLRGAAGHEGEEGAARSSTSARSTASRRSATPPTAPARPG